MWDAEKVRVREGGSFGRKVRVHEREQFQSSSQSPPSHSHSAFTVSFYIARVPAPVSVSVIPFLTFLSFLISL